MPDQEGKQKGPGTKTPDLAYAEGRAEDVQEGSLGADTGGAGVQKSRLPEGRDEPGSYQAGGFGDSPDDAPAAGSATDHSGEGDPSPHAQYDKTLQDEADAKGGLSDAPGEGTAGFTNAPVAPGDQTPEEVGKRGYAEQPDYDANDPDAKQPHPKTPSDMGNR